MADLAIDGDSFREAFERIGDAESRTPCTAADRIRSYHEHQLSERLDVHRRPGQPAGAADHAAGPGGRVRARRQASYPSTVLMTRFPPVSPGSGKC